MSKSVSLSYTPSYSKMRKLPRRGFIAMLAMALVSCLVGCGGKKDEPATVEEVMEAGGTYLEGVRIAGVDVSGKTLIEAQSLVQSVLAAKLNERVLTLTHDGQIWTLSPVQTGLSIDVNQTLQDALVIGRDGSTDENKQTKEDIKTSGTEAKIVYLQDESTFHNSARLIADEINAQPSNAYSEYDPDNKDRFNFIEGQSGKEVDIEALKSAAKAALLGETLTLTVEIPVTVTPPEIGVDVIKANTTRITVATTSYSKSNSANRVYNIAKAIDMLNGIRIKPGHNFSFNERVGERNERNGWKEAATIVGGSYFEDDFGGGICQVSTTLYNAVLKADLKIVERSKHSIPSTYVPYGLDAMVSYGSKDLVFQNNTDYPIYIFASIDKNGEKIHISVYGRPLPDGREIKMRSETVKETNPPDSIRLEDELSGVGSVRVEIQERKGYTVDVYKEYVVNGSLVESKKIYTDTYSPVQGVIAVGTRGAAPVNDIVDIPQEEDPGSDEPVVSAGEDGFIDIPEE